MISAIKPFSTQQVQPVQRNDVQREMLQLDRVQRNQTPQPSINPVPIRPNYTLPLALKFLRLDLLPGEQIEMTSFSEVPELEPATNYLMSHGYSQGIQQLTYSAALAAEATGNPFKARTEIDRAREPYQKVLAI